MTIEISDSSNTTIPLIKNDNLPLNLNFNSINTSIINYKSIRPLKSSQRNNPSSLSRETASPATDIQSFVEELNLNMSNNDYENIDDVFNSEKNTKQLRSSQDRLGNNIDATKMLTKDKNINE